MNSQVEIEDVAATVASQFGLKSPIEEAIAVAITKAVTAERDRCAKIARLEIIERTEANCEIADAVASAIRSAQ